MHPRNRHQDRYDFALLTRVWPPLKAFVVPTPDGRPSVDFANPAALRQVLANPRTWPGFFVNFGVAGSFLAFAGLWAVPYLQDVHGHSRALAAQHASLLLFGVAVGALIVGLVSDRLGSRRGVMRVYALLLSLIHI